MPLYFKIHKLFKISFSLIVLAISIAKNKFGVIFIYYILFRFKVFKYIISNNNKFIQEAYSHILKWKTKFG